MVETLLKLGLTDVIKAFFMPENVHPKRRQVATDTCPTASGRLLRGAFI